MYKIIVKHSYLLFLSLILIACSDSTNLKPEQEYLDVAKQKLDAKDYQGAINEYEELIKNYPKSQNAITAYNQIAGIYFENLKNYQESINTYKRLAEAFPDSKEAKQSLFMVAFIYDETLKDKTNAIASYKAFLEKYPNDTDPNDNVSESAKTMLQVLEGNLSIEDMIKKNIETTGTNDTVANEEIKTNGNLKKVEPESNDKVADDDKKDEGARQ